MALASNLGAAITTFTQDDLDNNRIRFIHDGSETNSAGFDISVADNGEDGAVASAGRFDIIINPVNDAPTAGVNTGVTLNEGATQTITTAMLNAADVDDSPKDVIFTISDAPDNGRMELNSNAGIAINSFSLYQLQQGLVRYVHNGSETIADSFDFTITDGDVTLASDTFNMTVTPVNDAPLITTNTGTSVIEGQTITLNNTMLNYTDADDTAADVTYTASAIIGGQIEVSGIVQNTFTQDDINNGRVVFRHDGNEGDASFNLSLADQGEDGAGADTGSFTLTKIDRNDSAVLTTNTGATLTEGASIVVTNAMLNATDSDDNAAGLDYTAAALTNGIIQVGGITQNTFTQDDIDNGRVVFIHDGSETITASFGFTLRDGLEHGAAATVAAFNMTITPVNDAPTEITLSGKDVIENSEIGTLIGTLSSEDSDLPQDNFSYSLTSNPGNIFRISGDRLVLNAELDFRQAESHRIKIQTDDGNGGLFEKEFVITVEDVNEVQRNNLEPARNILARDFRPERIEEDRLRDFIDQRFMQDLTSKLSEERIGAFYGTERFSQILRENTTFEVERLLGQSDASSEGFQDGQSIGLLALLQELAEQQEQENANNPQQAQDQNTKFQDINIQPMRELLAALADLNSEDQQVAESEDGEEGGSEGERSANLYDNFEEVLFYHEKRQADLKKALLQDI